MQAGAEPSPDAAAAPLARTSLSVLGDDRAVENHRPLKVNRV